MGYKHTLLNRWTKCECAKCGRVFNIRTTQLKYGRGKYCSRVCFDACVVDGMYDKRDQWAARNPNWKGGSDASKVNAANSKKVKVERNSAFISEFLRKHPCVDCGESDIVVLQFDHICGEKRRNVSSMVHGGNTLKTISDEMAKCAVRCSNCHLRVTRKRKQQLHPLHRECLQ